MICGFHLRKDEMKQMRMVVLFLAISVYRVVCGLNFFLADWLIVDLIVRLLIAKFHLS